MNFTWLAAVIRGMLFTVSSITAVMLCVQGELVAGRKPGWLLITIMLVASIVAMQIEGVLVYATHKVVDAYTKAHREHNQTVG